MAEESTSIVILGATGDLSGTCVGEHTLPAAMVRPDQGIIQWFVTRDAAQIAEDGLMCHS